MCDVDVLPGVGPDRYGGGPRYAAWIRVGISIDGCDVVSPPLGRLITLVKITLEWRLLKKLHRIKAWRTLKSVGYAMCSSFEVRPENGWMAS